MLTSGMQKGRIPNDGKQAGLHIGRQIGIGPISGGLGKEIGGTGPPGGSISLSSKPSAAYAVTRVISANKPSSVFARIDSFFMNITPFLQL